MTVVKIKSKMCTKVCHEKKETLNLKIIKIVQKQLN